MGMRRLSSLLLLLAGCASVPGAPVIKDPQILVLVGAEALGRSECAGYLKAHPDNGGLLAARLADVRALLARGASYDALANALLHAVPPGDLLYAAVGLQLVRNHLPGGQAARVDPASDAGRIFAALLDGCGMAEAGR